MRNLFIPNGMQAGKMLSFAGTESQMFMTTTALYLEEYQQKKKKKKRRVDAVSGIVSTVVSETVFFQLVYY